MTVQAQRRGGGGPFCLLCCVGLLALGFVVAVGETAIEVVPRADGHVESKHGTAAREVLQRPEPCEWHYSPSRQVVMRSRCDATTCAVSFLGAQGRGIAAASFAPAQMDGALELSSYFMARERRETVIARDRYVFLGVW